MESQPGVMLDRVDVCSLPSAEQRSSRCADRRKERFTMTTYLINHLRIPGGIPNEEGLSYLEQVERTVKAYGGEWLAQGDVRVLEGTWPGRGPR